MNKRSDYVIRNNNRKNNRSSKKKNIIIAASLSVVCIAAMAGIYRMEISDNLEEESLVNWQDTASSDIADKITVNMSDSTKTVSQNAAQAGNDGIENNFGSDSVNLEEKFAEAAKSLDNSENTQNNLQTAQNAGGSANSVNDESNVQENSLAQTSANNSVALSFDQNSSLAWPVKGNIILDYSMDSTIYFPTLDQYKYNPAIVISAEEGCGVKASANGIVESIEKNDETGLTVTMDIGGGYKLVYGQLKNVNYGTGAFIEKGQDIGLVAAPTKYYSIEGSNLYFEILNNEVPANPIEFLKDGVVEE